MPASPISKTQGGPGSSTTGSAATCPQEIGEPRSHSPGAGRFHRGRDCRDAPDTFWVICRPGHPEWIAVTFWIPDLAKATGLQAAYAGSGRLWVMARCDTAVVRAFAVLVSFWAAGTWGLWLVITRGLGPAAQFEGGWTAYTPLNEGDLVTSTGAGMWDAGMWDLVALWLAVMLTVTAVGAWSAAFVAHRNPGPPPS